MIKILGFAGSLRQNSFNRALLKTCLDLLPPDTSLEIFDLEGIPVFNQDFEKSPPPNSGRISRRRYTRPTPSSSLRRSIITPSPVSSRTLSTGLRAHMATTPSRGKTQPS